MSEQRGPALSELTVGDVVAERTVQISRDNLVRYAGASGDFNAIHYRDDIATSVGLPGVLAHGMLTMGFAVQPVADWVGDPGRITGYQVRFTRPVLVGPDGFTEVTIAAKVGALTEIGARVDLTVSVDGSTVLGKAQVTVKLT
jgi:acyl dehydratase